MRKKPSSDRLTRRRFRIEAELREIDRLLTEVRQFRAALGDANKRQVRPAPATRKPARPKNR